MVGDDEVGLAVAVEVRRRHGGRARAGGEGLLGGEDGMVAPSPLSSSTLTLLAPSLATTRSGLPSPLRSATATETG